MLVKKDFNVLTMLQKIGKTVFVFKKFLKGKNTNENWPIR